MRERISVIVPIYHGKKYIKPLIHMLEAGAAACRDRCTIEFVLSNDDPESPLDGYVSNHMEIRTVETDVNRGIHGARVRGLEYCTGDYVVFLDQDDVIRNNYIESQCRKIGNADAVVCRLINGKRLHYTDTFRFEEVITRDFMLHHWCSIVSPGQVLLRKAAIPNIWKENILSDNGADDYFLWLCMMAEGKRFALNQEVLFTHVITGMNTSENTNLMMDSEEEMLSILNREKVFTGDDANGFEDLKRSLRRIHVKMLDAQRKSLVCLDRINRSLRQRGAMYDWMRKNRGRKIAIYGAGELGLAMYDLLKEQGVIPLCYLDRNAEYIMADIPAYTMESAEVKLDSILLTISDRDLEEKLGRKFSCEVVNVEKIR